jgi:hypothetical protein
MRLPLPQFLPITKIFGSWTNFEVKEGCMIAFKIESKVGSKIREPLRFLY